MLKGVPTSQEERGRSTAELGGAGSDMTEVQYARRVVNPRVYLEVSIGTQAGAEVTGQAGNAWRPLTTARKLLPSQPGAWSSSCMLTRRRRPRKTSAASALVKRDTPTQA